jgi:hypothetical protein
MRAARYVLGAASLLLGASVSAQTLPVPSPPPPVDPEPAATLPGTPSPSPPPAGLPYDQAVPGMRARPWEYEASVGMGWDSNIDLQAAEGRSDLAFIPSGRVARVFSGARGLFRAAAAGHWMGYTSEKAFNRGYGEISLDGRFDSSPRTSWKGDASYVLGYSDASEPLLQQGVLPPLVKTRTLTGALAVTQRLGERLSLRLDGRVYRTDFASPEWFDGSSRRGTIALERKLRSRDTAALVYSVEHVSADQTGSSYLTHFGSLQYTRALSPQTAILLEGGVSYTPDRVQAGLDRAESFFGGATITRQVKRATLSAFVRREVAPAFGISLSRLELRTGVHAALPMGRAWELGLDGIHVAPSDAGVNPGSYSATHAAVVLSRRLGNRLSLSGRSSFNRRGPSGALPSVRAFEAGLQLGFTSLPATAREPHPPIP